MTKTRTYYLAYGMNTNLRSMEQRCPNAISLGKVILPDHELKFKHFCDIEYKKDSQMECVLWSITEECERSLDRLEGYPDFYLKKEVQVKHQGKTITAMVYYMTDNSYYQLPSEYYFELVLAGYLSHHMNVEQIHAALDQVLNDNVLLHI